MTGFTVLELGLASIVLAAWLARRRAAKLNTTVGSQIVAAATFVPRAIKRTPIYSVIPTRKTKE